MTSPPVAVRLRGRKLPDPSISIELSGLYENERNLRRAIWKLDNDGTVYWADSNNKFGSCSPEEFRAWAKRKVEVAVPKEGSSKSCG